MNVLKFTPNGGVVLCGRKTCCPVIEKIDENRVKITDDDGNSVTMDIEQARLIGQALEQLK